MGVIQTVGPNEALVRSGGGDQPKVVVGGRTLVIPIFHRSQRLPLSVMTLHVKTENVYTGEGVAVSVDGVAQVKVARSEEAIRTAAQQFLGKTELEVQDVPLQTLEGHQRAILGTLTVEEIYRDREKFASQVRTVASPDLAGMGLEIVSFTIRDIKDPGGYLDALGVRRTAEVRRDATIGQAEAERDAGIRSAEAKREQEAATFEAETRIAESERGYNVQKAAYDQEVNARQAEAELADELQRAKTQQEIRREEVEIEVVERAKQIELQQQEIQRRERELEATVRKPAEAERYRLETIAEGNRNAVVAEAAADADATRLQGEAQAEVIRLTGQAEAEAIEAKGAAEAAAMKLKAEAWKQYGEAAVIQQVLETLPAVAEAVAQPLARTDRIVMFGGGDGGGTGASKLTRDITRTVAQVPEVIESLTGIDIVGSIKNIPGLESTTRSAEAENEERAQSEPSEQTDRPQA
ncbi:MAG: flotillin family protein [Chloroflexi bacterium]|nr:flotillin family protein [Chloroflexota bacterium]MYC00520.1 flotillin family protein [Chloroflexota bacterium]